MTNLNIQYADFAIWQRQWLTGEVLQTQLSYWQTQLGGNLPILNLPLDYGLSAGQDHRGVGEHLSI